MELFPENDGVWSIDVYEELPDLWACVEHQLRERQWRKEHAGNPRRIVERYHGESAMRGVIVVVDRAEWYWRDASDDGRTDGPLAVWFDTREKQGRRIVGGGIDIGDMVFEQIEMRVERMPTATHPNRDLQRVWAQALKWQPEDGEESQEDTYAPMEAEPGTKTESRSPSPPMQLADACITTSGGSIILQTDDDPELIYTIYPIFATPADRTSIARRFATCLRSQSVRLEVAPQFAGIRECIGYAASADTNVGYRSAYGRRFPAYGSSSGTMQMRESPSIYKRFLVVLDNEEWEREDGVCFVWVGDTGEIIVGRVGRGMRGVAERLRGES